MRCRTDGAADGGKNTAQHLEVPLLDIVSFAALACCSIAFKMTLVLDDNQMKKAIKALMSHSEKVRESGATRQLFEDEGDVFNLQIALKKVPEKVSEKPV